MMHQTLTQILRPSTLDEFVGQKHIIGKETALYKLIQQNKVPHLLFHGKPGLGKTTLAKIISKKLDTPWFSLNATSLKVEQIRQAISSYKQSLFQPVIFIDEVHRLSTNQQEVLLPIMENQEAIVIGATTENPYHTLTAGIRSRAFIYEFKTLSTQQMHEVLDKAKSLLDINLDKEQETFLINSSSGDARALLNLLYYAYSVDKKVSILTLKQLRQQAIVDGTSSQDTHYDLASALIKSLRGSDVDASVYYLARLVEGSEDVRFITRRLMIFASEDIGNANPNALNLAVSTHQACQDIGHPEARIILAQCVVYLAHSPKSNSAYSAINKAINSIKNGTILEVPSYLKGQNTGYKYPHDYGGWVKQAYMTKEVKTYKSSGVGFEKNLQEWIQKIKGE